MLIADGPVGAGWGLLIEGNRGSVKNPAYQIAREYRRSLLAWAARFGLTPSDRDRMRNPGKAEDEISLHDILFDFED